MDTDELLDVWEEKWRRRKDGMKLRSDRMALGWSLRTAAEVTGLSPSYIGRAERGELAIPEHVLRIFSIAYNKAAETLGTDKEAWDGSCHWNTAP